MHQSSYHIMTQFHHLLVSERFKDEKMRVLDVGSLGVNGTYREIFSDRDKFIYTGLDVNPGPNVDYVPNNPYEWPDLDDESFDVIVSGQAFEHIEFPWLIIREMGRKLRRNGLICIVAPSRGPEHKYPVDCWRYYPDGFRALAKWAALTVLDTKTFWGKSGFSDGSDQWGDTYCILCKGEGDIPHEKTDYSGAAIQRTTNRNNPISLSKTGTYYSFARQEVIDSIIKNSISAKRVLEIGCAGGATGKRLKELAPVDYYMGIELSEEAASIARQHLDKVIVADVEKADMSKDIGLKQNDFDLILALDVLEHLYDPWDILANLTDYLKPGGHVIASIPNIQNISVVKELLKGRWRYEGAGILDATHLRFFTFEEIEKMFSGAGLSIKKSDRVLNPPINTSAIKEKGNSFNHDNITITGLTKEEVLRLFTYQYVVIAEKEGADIAHRSVPDFKVTSKGIVSIVILTFNQLKYTKECVESIRRHTPEPHEVVFVDNGSTDGTVKWLKEIISKNTNYKLIENKKNLGFAKGCNQGITASSGEYVLLLNNDVVVTEGWLSGLLECLNGSPHAGIVGPMTNNISGPQRVESVDYGSVDRLEGYAESFREKNRYRRVPLRRIVGFCMLFRREMVEKIGLLDESFGSGNFEDDDYCLRSELGGFKNMIAGDVFIHHYGSRSFIGNRMDYGSAMTGNRKIFSEKWSGIDAKSDLGSKIVILNAIEKADALYQEGKIEKSAETLLKSMESYPKEKRLYYALSEILINAGLYKDAFDVLGGLPDEDNDVRKLELAGYCKQGMELYQEADDYADRALSSNSGSAAALNLKGVIAFRKGDNPGAEKLFTKAIECDRGFGEPHSNLGVLKWSSGNKEEALGLLERGFILSPTGSNILNSYDSAVTEMGEFARGEKVFREAIGLHPRNKRLAYLFVDILIRQGKYKEAMDKMEGALISFGMDDESLSSALELRNLVGPKEIDKTGNKRGTVSSCMIVKNEERHMARCLRSIEAVVDEMIVVDTGSSDRTKDIAKAFGAKVYDFGWTGDFSEARNFSTSKAAGEWVLVLDADEVISSQDHLLLKEIVRKGRNRPSAYSLVTRNYLTSPYTMGWTANDGKYPSEQAGIGWIPSVKVRLFPNDARIRFENPVHELVESSLKKAGIPIKDCIIPVHHYGKLNAEKNAVKGEAYYQLGLKKLDEKEDELKALYELAIQAGGIGKYDEAVALWQKLIAINPSVPTAYINLGSAYLNLRKIDGAIKASQKAMELAPDSKEAAYNHALYQLYAGNTEEAILEFEKQIKKTPDYPLAMAGLFIAYGIRGDREKVKKYLEMLQGKSFSVEGYIYSNSKKLESFGRLDSAISLLESAVENNTVNKDILTILADFYKKKVESNLKTT